MKTVRQDPTSPSFVQDPYPYYRLARAEGDFVFWQDYGMTAAVTHRAVDAVMRDPRFARVPLEGFSKAPDHLKAFAALEARSLLNLAPPEHTDLRAAVMRNMTTGRIKALAPQIETIAKSLIDAFPDASFDLMSSFCNALPVQAIAALLGVPISASTELLTWSRAMCALYRASPSANEEAEAETASCDFHHWVTSLLDEKQRAPGPDVLSDLAALECEGAITRADSISTAVLLLNAGHEATALALGNAFAILSDCNHRGPVGAELVEECLRIDPPLHLFIRWAQTDLELFGHKVAAGEQIACLLGSANHDAAMFQDPTHFDTERTLKANAAFGVGRHFCLGAGLARLEMQIGLTALFHPQAKVRITNSPRYADRYHFHGFDRIEVTRAG
ncbi:MAG: cytochrome P450 [Pseudomonadota bacterium]